MINSESPSPLVAPIVTGLFDEGKDYHTFRSQGTQDWLLTFTTKGGGAFCIEDSIYEACPGDLYLIQPGTVHDYGTSSAQTHWRFYWAHFLALPHWSRYVALTRLTPGLYAVSVENMADRDTIECGLQLMHNQSTVGSSLSKELAMNALESVLIRAFYWSLQIVQRLDPRISSVDALISSDLSRAWTLNALSNHCNLSVSRFSHVFRAEVGVTPQQYIESKRMERARQLLALTGMSIQAISADVGFENAFYFSNRFKLLIGMSPSAYRSQVMQESG